MNSWLDDFKNAESVVKAVLTDNPETRADDRKLIIKVWEVQGLKLEPEQKSMSMRILPVETITRARRKIQENGLYRPIKEVYDQRQLLDENVSKYMVGGE